VSNDNCLEGMRCPKCGSLEPFNIEVTKIVTVYDSGTEDSKYGDTEWTNDSYADCVSCGWTGIVDDLYVSR
jgi:predicted nucleic-acid-binding Zn-ribbon protein